ncbi:glycosyltransferase family 4 protein [Patescibacteria group bacterium]|nr:glycosyltransferase family 4 protein [Patescibacteria group bacterium]MBU4458386.1 glycosyltransferase family 4 protein [Patescibacteria group bacterium]MCG2695859.1 glycosyltransferase family 4 protein [Candidatus Portnoybacteria bacterium]
MPILHYPPIIGGFEIFSQNIAERIGKTDNVFVITSRVANAPSKEINNNLRILRTSPWSLKNLSYSKPWFIVGAMIWIFFKSIKLIKKEKIELIHAQGFLSGIISLILKKLTKVPYLLTIQSADFSVYHPRLNINIIKAIYKKMEKAVFKNADYCHAVSNYLADHIRQYYVQKVEMIPNGVNWERFRPDVDKLKTRKELGFDAENLIVCVSRLEHKNGTHDLIESVKYLQDFDFKLMICGSGSEKEKLEKMIKDFNLEDRVFLLGDILHSELPKYVACADIFVRPSLAEGFGIVFLEAMACSVAVIGTPVGGIPDFLKDRETGLFCEPGNPKDIAEKIKKLLADKELYQKLTVNGLKMVREIYNWDQVVRKLKELYTKTINNN